MRSKQSVVATSPAAWNHPVPTAVDSLEHYTTAVNRLPFLTAEEELEYARDYQITQNTEAARRLVLSHLRLVVSVARHYLGYGLPLGDLIQEGNFGLMKAVKRFDPERGVRLVSFAIYWIKAEMHEYILRNWRLVRLATTKAQRKLFFNLRSHKKGLHALTPAEAESIAKELNVNTADVLEMETRMAGGEVGFDGPADSGDDETSFAPINYLTDPDDEPSRQLAEVEIERIRHEALNRELGKLDPRSRRIIEARWLAADESKANLIDLGHEFSISAERVRQIEVKAMKKMKAAMAEYA
jgi:RNA polymerase sigma-32 factor